MAEPNYSACVVVVAHNEGGFANNPHDPGRATMRGVTQATYDDWRTQHGLGKQSVAMISDAEIDAIYRTYWDGGELPVGLDAMQLDGAINSGKVRGNKWIQVAVGAQADGHIGPRTVKAANSCDVPSAISKAAAARMGFLRALRTWRYFGKGWSTRVAYTEAQAMAMHARAVQRPVAQVVAPALAQAQKKVQARAQGAVGAIVAAAGGSVAGFDLSSAPHWLIPAAIGAGALAFIGLARSRAHHAHRVAALTKAGASA